MEIVFGIYKPESKDAKAVIKNGVCVEIKLIVKCPRRFYYSMLNDAAIAFNEQYPQYG